MRSNWYFMMGVLLVTTASLGAGVSQAEDGAAEGKTSSKVECKDFTLEGLAPGMTYAQADDLLRARRPKLRSAGKQRNYDEASRVQAVHSWQVEAGILEVWYETEQADRKKNPTVVRVRLVVPEEEVNAEELWKSVFDRFGPMSNWEREDCNIGAVVGRYKSQVHTTLSLLSWEAPLRDEEVDD